MTKVTKYRSDLQVLRGLAILAVLLFHFREGFFPLGYLGVDVFFVLSGFVVTPLILRIFSSELDKSVFENLKRFYLRRFYRLAPAMGVTIIGSAILIFLFGSPADHQRFARQGIASLLLIGNFGAIRYSGDYFSPNPNPLLHTWSLSVEEQIYLVLPLILLVLLLKRHHVKIVATAIFTLITFISFLLFIYPQLLNIFFPGMGIEFLTKIAFYSPTSRIWQFSLGGLCFLLLGFDCRPLSKLARVASAVVIGILLILVDTKAGNFKSASILVSVVTFILIAAGNLNDIPRKCSDLLKWLGNRSYSIYLVHMPLMYLANYSPFFRTNSLRNQFLIGLVFLALSVICGSFIYSRIENAFRLPNSFSISKNSVSKLVILFLIFPFLLLTGVDSGARHNYWGLVRTIDQPLYAGDVDKDCMRQNDSTLSSPCVYHQKLGRETVLLIGDSHATHLSQALIDSASETDWMVAIWTHGHCPIQFSSSITNEVTPYCLTENLRMLDWVKSNRPKSIIVSQFVRNSSSQTDLRNGLDILANLVPNVLLVVNNPIFPDGNEFMILRPLVMKPYDPPKFFRQSDMLEVDKNASKSLGIWAQDNGIKVLDPESIFCSNGICTRYANGNWLYWDDDHFSLFGASLLKPQFREYLDSINRED